MVVDNNSKVSETAMVEVKPAIAPDSLTDGQRYDIQKQADDAVNQLINAKGSDVFSIAEQIQNVGIVDQKTVSSNIALLQERMGNVFYSPAKTSATSNLSKNITALRDTLAKINPNDSKREGIYRLIGILPFFGNRIVVALKSASTKGMTLEHFVKDIEDSLKTGEVMLRQDNAQLKVMYIDLEVKEKLISTDAYFAEVLLNKLHDAVEKQTDEKIKNNLNKVLFKVATRAQDLRAMNHIHEQFFVGIEMTRDNNDLLIDSVRRMLTMGMNVVYVSFAIHAALQRSKNVKEVAAGTGEFIGDMLVENAKAINGMVTEIGDLYKRPFVSMEKLEKAKAELMQAIDATNKLKSDGIETARENIGKIKIMTEELKTKAGQLPDTDIKSLEASKTLQLTSGRS